MVVAKRQRSETAHENRTKEGPRTGVRTSGKTNSPPGQPNLQFTQGRLGGGEKTDKKRSQHWARGSSSLWSLGQPALMPRGYIFLSLPVKLSCNTGPSEEITQGCHTGPSVASNFCCDETEPRKSQTPLTLLMSLTSSSFGLFIC